MNMMRAGVVKHPRDWPASGYHEIQTPSQRYRTVDLQALLCLLEITSLSELQQRHLTWIEEAIQHDNAQYNAMWSNCIAVGNEAFVEEVKSQLALKTKYRDIHAKDDAFLLRETDGAYTAHFVGETDF
jgi:putative transposase